MRRTILTRHSSLPGSTEKMLVCVDIVEGDRRIAGVTLRHDHDDAWHLAQAHQMAAASELLEFARRIRDIHEPKGATQLCVACGLDGNSCTQFHQAIAVIALAEGRSL